MCLTDYCIHTYIRRIFKERILPIHNERLCQINFKNETKRRYAGNSIQLMLTNSNKNKSRLYEEDRNVKVSHRFLPIG